MAGPRLATVAALVRCDVEAFAHGDRRNVDGTPMDAEDVALVNEATLEEVEAARAIVASRLSLRAVGGGVGA